ncbi:hypothetical protein EYF80_045112 [Liparis tanakae]|uniref:Uncharacterized protein n=1 Tax=Liparis tanakae TaxID=230148 RepID=A0A4Z2FV52_9TELE|nr:hypothetical protein EYF80_045112 [Liparis tanakae]
MELGLRGHEWTHLPIALVITETDSAPRRPPMAKMETVRDQRRVAVSSVRGSPYLWTHVLL